MKVLVIPGLNDGTEWYEECVDDWEERFGFEVLITTLDWRKGRGDYEDEYARLVELVMRENVEAVIGVSAGAAMAVALLEDQALGIRKAVLLSARASKRSLTYYLLYPGYLRNYPLHLEALDRAHDKDFELVSDRILTIADWRDVLVPPRRTRIRGAKNMVVNVGGSWWKAHREVSRRGLRVCEKEIVEWLLKKF